jgi:hypothetical protein
VKLTKVLGGFGLLGVILGAMCLQLLPDQSVVGTAVLSVSMTVCIGIWSFEVWFHTTAHEIVDEVRRLYGPTLDYSQMLRDEARSDLEDLAKILDSLRNVSERLGRLNSGIESKFESLVKDHPDLEVTLTQVCDKLLNDVDRQLAEVSFRYLPFSRYLRKFTPRQKAMYVDALLSNDWRKVNAVVRSQEEYGDNSKS